ncbi:MAG: hypothetical protein V4605_08570, partial [Pseudomonadota bacterium]
MTATNLLNISDYLKYADLQMAAEAFIRENGIGGKLFGEGEALQRALIVGNKHSSRFTKAQAAQFAE